MGDDVTPEVAVGKRGGKEVVGESLTPGHLDVTLEATQHASVALGELAAQCAHSPGKFVEYPQFCASLRSPVTHPALSESDGSAQFVKSARIWSMKLDRGVPQSSGSTVMPSSLVAC